MSKFTHLFSYTLKNEGGRSMVEMLGVLAVIGVLSIGGVLAYRLGMDKYRANELVSELNIRYVSLVQQLTKDAENVDMELGDKTKHGYDVSVVLDDVDDRYFYLNVEDLPTGVCKEILRLEWSAPTEIFVSELSNQENPEVCGTEQIVSLMEFKFDKYASVSH